MPSLSLSILQDGMINLLILNIWMVLKKRKKQKQQMVEPELRGRELTFLPKVKQVKRTRNCFFFFGFFLNVRN